MTCPEIALMEVGKEPRLVRDCGLQTANRLYEEVGAKTVRIHADFRPAGSGFFVGDGTQVVTNFHVSDLGSVLSVEMQDGRRYNARVVKIDDVNDLSLLQVQGLAADKGRAINIEPLKSPHQSANRDEHSSYALGHPFGIPRVVMSPGGFAQRQTMAEFAAGGQQELLDELQGLASVTDGDLLDIQRAQALRSPRNVYNMVLQPGNSGGPIVNANGGLEAVSQSITPFASSGIPSEVVRDFLNSPAKYTPVYESRSAYQEDPAGSLLGDGIRLAALRYTKLMPVIAAYEGLNAWGSHQLLQEGDAGGYSRTDLMASMAASGTMITGAAMRFVPALRTAGVVTFAAGLVGNAINKLIPYNEYRTGYNDASGNRAEPYRWEFQ